MFVGTVLSSEGQYQTLDYEAGVFRLDGTQIDASHLGSLDAAGQVNWTSPETARWARSFNGSEYVFDEATSTASWFSSLPLWAKAIFVLLWPISIPYGIVRMWKTRRVPVVVRLFVTAAAVVTFLFSTAASVATFSPRPTAAPALRDARPDTTPRQSVEENTDPASEPESESESPVALMRATVIRVVDGDTAVFQLEDGSEEKVRFIGIDTPESTTEVEAYGKEASDYTCAALPAGTQVLLEKGLEERDQYGRLLAYIWLERPTSLRESEIRSKMFNAKLALDGYAQQMTIQPNSKYADFFKRFVSEARLEELGLWSPLLEPEPKAEVPPAGAPASTSKPHKSSSSRTVYVTNTGSKYHAGSCGYLRSSKHAISLADAKAQGYTPCSRCDP